MLACKEQDFNEKSSASLLKIKYNYYAAVGSK